MTLLSDIEQPEKRAYSVREFCAAFSIGRTLFYEEVNAGHLRIVKLGTKTLVRRSDADQWESNRLIDGGYRHG